MSKQTTGFYEIFNKAEDKSSVDIMLYGAIPDFDLDTYKMKNQADKFVSEFKKLEKDFDRINIYINSPGGYLYHAFPIFNVIANSKKDVHTYNDGLAASAGGYILLAGKTIHTAKNAFLMIHRASGIAFGNADKMRDTADMMEKYEGVIIDRLASISGQSKEDIQDKYFDGKDHFLTAEEAKEAGFVNEIEDYESEDAPPSNITNMAFGEVMNLYKKEQHSEESLITRITNHLRKTFTLTPAKQEGQDPPAPTPTPNPTNTDMNFENSLSLLSKETVTAEDLAAIKAELQAYHDAGEKFTDEEVQNRITEATATLSEEITNLSTEKANAETLVSSLTEEKETLSTEKGKLDTEVKNLKVTVEAYRKSGVKPVNAKSDDPDKIDGEEGAVNFTSETDVEIKRQRAEMGIGQ
ncbi:head maturation protease, ClpP-related [Mongoliibacter ruber]|uniref:ATP-dependent Clp protease proteolytic subunit n=1 Tax=Mongoliibacter ruber TaxID=1750599 RepID=A0A2T0WV66_9BACT|nr:head maturation protease, ClpP-related [Mongoliibacter ruber]PRY90591.1 ATP-dependent Clp endopeptidase proteolytic subunit ClpP [Mongoliibacter ruber]